MKRILVMMVLLTATVSIPAQTATSAAKKMQVEQEILKTGQDLRDAYLKRDVQTAKSSAGEYYWLNEPTTDEKRTAAWHGPSGTAEPCWSVIAIGATYTGDGTRVDQYKTEIYKFLVAQF